MKERWTRPLWVGTLLAVASVLLCIGQANAQSANSTHFRVDQAQFGSGASVNSCSDDYCGQASIGDLVTGSSSSDSYKADFGNVVAGEPMIQIIALGGIQNMGLLDVGRTATATAVVKVQTYLSSGYVVQITGATPSQGVHALSAMTTPSTSHQGAEQFGINLVANTAPEVGADPVQVPSGQGTFGQVADDYATANLFKYVSGDRVAYSETSSGQTEYTITMIVNVSNTTPGGKYSGEFSAVVTPTY